LLKSGGYHLEKANALKARQWPQASLEEGGTRQRFFRCAYYS